MHPDIEMALAQQHISLLQHEGAIRRLARQARAVRTQNCTAWNWRSPVQSLLVRCAPVNRDRLAIEWTAPSLRT
ncbi:MAG TPA: hypothetical protein VKQ71_05460 [Acidimicrobiales bacterium]|nr:hypothetical protein [Acidimicrobiales bacterium]